LLAGFLTGWPQGLPIERNPDLAALPVAVAIAAALVAMRLRLPWWCVPAGVSLGLLIAILIDGFANWVWPAVLVVGVLSTIAYFLRSLAQPR